MDEQFQTGVVLTQKEKAIVESVQEMYGFGSRGFSAALRFVINKFEEYRLAELSQKAQPPDPGT